MKTQIFVLALLFSLFGTYTKAQTEHINLSVPDYIRPLAEQWAADYNALHNNITFQFVSAKNADNANSISVSTDEDAVFFARVAVLAVTAKDSPAEYLVKSLRFNKKKLKLLFFLDEEDEERKSATAEKLHIYYGGSARSLSGFYAKQFEEEPTAYRGKKVVGDDRYLTEAVRRDPFGITFNALSNIADTRTRHLKEELALVPLDLDKQSRQILDSGQLDDIIRLLEQQRIDGIPVGKVGLTYDHRNPLLNNFVRWILTDGTADVHNFGLLQLTQQELTAQQQRLDPAELAQN